jgi:TonB family protein
MIPRIIRLSISLIVLLWLAAVPCLLAQTEIPAIPTDEAMKHLTKKVDPITPPIARLMKTGGPVAADIVIAPDGSVESAKVTSGPPILLTAAIAAIKQWKFDPFVENGYPIRVRTSVEVAFAGQMSQAEQANRQDFFPVDDKCRQLIHDEDYPDAEKTCSDAVDLSNKLPADAVLERSGAQSLLGHALLQ